MAVKTVALTMVLALIAPVTAVAQGTGAGNTGGAAATQSHDSQVFPTQSVGQIGQASQRGTAVVTAGQEGAAAAASPSDAAARPVRQAVAEGVQPDDPAPDSREAPANGGGVAAQGARDTPASDAPAPDPAPQPPSAPAPQPAAMPAPAPQPAQTPAPPAASAVDPAVAACRSTAGPATAGVPTGARAAQAHRDALAAAASVCMEAAKGTDAPADVLFLASEIAQAQRQFGPAFELLQRAADKGFGPAETRLGDYYLFGLAPGGKDSAKAIAHYETAAALGDAPGMTTLALMYRVGKGEPRDPARMVGLLTQAADRGYHFAQYRLAQTYLSGDGIPGRSDPALGIPDPARAAALFTKAADAGNVAAALELARLYGDPNSAVGEKPEEQARLTLIASRAGLPEAIAAMGVLYETGRGVEKNPDVAARLYVKALESGKVAFDALRKGAPQEWDYDTAIAFQKLLQERGLYDGALDGVVGAGTAAGARALAGR